MTKADLVEQVAEAIGPGITKKDCALVVDGFLNAVKLALANGESIEIRGFGTFKVRKRKTRVARNPRTGDPVEVPLVTDTSPVGAAVCAALAGGVQEDLAACAKLIGTVAKTIDPNPVHRAAYDDAYGAYRRLFNSLGPMFN